MHRLIQNLPVITFLAISVALMLLSLLSFTPPPTYEFWKLGLLSMEWGGWFLLILILLVPLIFWWTRMSDHSHLPKLSLAVTVISAMLFAIPIVNAQIVSTNRFVDLSLARFFVGSLHASRAEVQRDLQYASRDGKALTLDVYSPAPKDRGAATLRSAIVVVHGGGWNHGAKSDFAPCDRWLTESDLVVFDINYRLADPKAQFPTQLEDVFSALDWIKHHASEYGVDPHRLCLLGRSAGGQLALLAAYKIANSSIGSDVLPVCAVISLYGPTDLVWGYNNVCVPDLIGARFLLENYLGGTPKSVPEMYAAASPIMHVSKRCPPTLLFHGNRDHLVSDQHLRFLRDKLNAVGVPCDAVLLDMADHGFDANFDGLHWQIAQAEIERFLKKFVLLNHSAESVQPL